MRPSAIASQDVLLKNKQAHSLTILVDVPVIPTQSDTAHTKCETVLLNEVRPGGPAFWACCARLQAPGNIVQATGSLRIEQALVLFFTDPLISEPDVSFPNTPVSLTCFAHFLGLGSLRCRWPPPRSCSARECKAKPDRVGIAIEARNRQTINAINHILNLGMTSKDYEILVEVPVFGIYVFDRLWNCLHFESGGRGRRSASPAAAGLRRRPGRTPAAARRGARLSN
jgi:hypothetical protein